MVILLAIPCDRKYQPKWCMELGEWIARRATEYFHMKCVFEDEDAIKKAKPAFFVLEPHDVLPLSIIAFSDATGSLERANHKCLGCITSTCFNVPLMRHFYSWANAVPATKEVINGMLSEGISPCICPGGVQEVALITKRADEINVFLKKRKGFIKIALSHGAPIVPVFAFGVRDAYDFWILQNSIFKFIGRKLGFMPMIFFGHLGVPFGPGKPCNFVNVVGKPIPSPKKPYNEITEADVDAVHSVYLEEFAALFERHKRDYGYGNVKLNIH